jgi:hypothetical protein
VVGVVGLLQQLGGIGASLRQLAGLEGLTRYEVEMIQTAIGLTKPSLHLGKRHRLPIAPCGLIGPDLLKRIEMADAIRPFGVAGIQVAGAAEKFSRLRAIVAGEELRGVAQNQGIVGIRLDLPNPRCSGDLKVVINGRGLPVANGQKTMLSR